MSPTHHTIQDKQSRNRAILFTGGMAIAIVILAVTEAALRVVDYDYQPREKKLYLPKISGFDGTRQFYLDTSFAAPGYIWKTEPNTKYTDRNGFRLPEIPFEHSPDKIRVAFLGGSTTQGGHRPYPERAIQLLNEASGTNHFEALNAACSSYSTHQSLIALDRWVLPRHPDILVVYHGWNDIQVTEDGYSDKEKDYLVSETGDPRLKMPAFINKLRLTDVLRRSLAYVDRSWPRQRVSYQDIENNYEAMARRCADLDIRMIIIIRPSKTNLENAQLSQEEISTYRLKAELITEIQRVVASRHAHVDIVDAESVLNELQKKTPDQPVFLNDACHIYEYPEEILAQSVAMAITPEQSAAISNHMDTAEYTYRVASELINAVSPREAAMLIREHMQRNSGDIAPGLEALLRRAESDFRFADLFRQGRMGGDLKDPAAKIDALKQCQALRPYDTGVKQQIDFVTQSSDRAHVPKPGNKESP